MNCQRAFKILEIDSLSANTETIRKQYKIMALKWHPDRNKAANATERYREIKEAHDFLLENDSEIANNSSYTEVASLFFETLYNNEHFQRKIFHPLLMKVVNLCEEKALAFILRLDADRASKLMTTIETYKSVLHFSDVFFEKVKNHMSGMKHTVLNPNIDDLMQCNVCKIEGIIVPLWHSLLEYDRERIIVHCLPELPSNMWIDDGDDENTLSIKIQERLDNIWKTGFLEISIGSEKKSIEMDVLKMQRTQVVVLRGEGIPIPQIDDVFNVTNRGIINIHLEII